MLSFERYQELGGVVEENKFLRLCKKAESTVNLYTFGRIAGEEDLHKERLEFCLFDLVEIYLNDNNGMKITSLSSSAGSESISQSMESKNIDSIIIDAITIHLGAYKNKNGIPLLERSYRL